MGLLPLVCCLKEEVEEELVFHLQREEVEGMLLLLRARVDQGVWRLRQREREKGEGESQSQESEDEEEKRRKKEREEEEKRERRVWHWV